MIDYRKIANAIDHYKKYGFELINVPWCVTEEANRATLPDHLPRVVTPWGDLVGSAEQSFIDMMIDSLMPYGRYMAVTPCFRYEKEYSELSRPYFMKLELIVYRSDHHWSNVSKTFDNTQEFMIEAALAFFRSYITCEVVSMNDGSHDIISSNGIELGSYGVRSYKNYTWIYGTGLAEPRLSAACDVLRHDLKNR
jgi:hypothetical protein